MSLTAQTTLTGNTPLMLDATCSTKVKTHWPKEGPLRMDIRREAKPDIVGDARCLPFRDGIFDRIYCDPPHIIDKRGMVKWGKPVVGRWFASVNRGLPKMAAEMHKHSMRRFGIWKSYDEWLRFVKGTNDEFARCLTKDGILEYKICEVKGNRKVSLKDLELMNRFEIVAKKQTTSNRGNSTYWLTLKPKPPTVHEAERAETP